MSKKHGKRRGAPKDDVVWRQSAEEATLARKPYYNAFACGHGVHGDTKYNRAKEKRTWKRDLQKGASRGSFLYGEASSHDEYPSSSFPRFSCCNPFGLHPLTWNHVRILTTIELPSS